MDSRTALRNAALSWWTLLIKLRLGRHAEFKIPDALTVTGTKGFQGTVAARNCTSDGGLLWGAL